MGMGLSHILCLAVGFALAWKLKPTNEQKSEKKGDEQEPAYHFLFNSLTTIRFLTKEDPKKAGELVLCLSQYLKIIWSVGSRHDLNRELELCHAYLRLEEGRLEERLQLNWDVVSIEFPTTVEIGAVQEFLGRIIDERIRKERGGGHLSLQLSQVDREVLLSIYCDLGIPQPSWELLTGAVVHLESDRLVIRSPRGNA